MDSLPEENEKFDESQLEKPKIFKNQRSSLLLNYYD